MFYDNISRDPRNEDGLVCWFNVLLYAIAMTPEFAVESGFFPDKETVGLWYLEKVMYPYPIAYYFYIDDRLQKQGIDVWVDIRPHTVIIQTPEDGIWWDDFLDEEFYDERAD